MSTRQASPAKSLSFWEGNRLVFRSEWRNDGALATPTNYEFIIYRGDHGSTVTIPSGGITVESTGILYVEYGPGFGGRWYYTWHADEGTIEGSFYITTDITDLAGVTYPAYG